MMRVAFVTTGVAIGGTSTFTLFLSSALRRLGIPCEVFSFTNGNPFSSEFAETGIPVHTQDETRLIYEDRLEKVYDGLRAFKPTAVFAVLGMEAFEVLRYLPPGVARIGIFHDRAVQPQVNGPKFRHTLDHLVVVASYLREDIHRLDPQFPCTYLAHGIPIPKETPPRSPNFKDPLRLLYYGRFENSSKGVRLFPEIATALKRRQIPFVWTLHGSGPEEEFLKNAFAEDIQTGQVIFSKTVKYAELPERIRSHDIYLLASTNEGGPLTLLESMALGLVPVCGDIPCLVQEVITAQNGFRVRRDDPEAYAEAIDALHKDRGQLERFSADARRTITEHFSSEAMAERYLAFLKSLPVGGEVHWPARIRPRPILGTSGTVRLSQSLGILRQMRRFLKRVKSGAHL
jgi:glycosyltransferase involved in cell wall biosynthesis